MSSRRGSHSSWWKNRSVERQNVKPTMFDEGNLWGIPAPVYGCELPPSTALPRKDERLLGRLQAGDTLWTDPKCNRFFRVSKGARPYEVNVRKATIERLVNMGNLRRVGVRYDLTRPALVALPPAKTDSEKLIAAAERLAA